MPTATVLYLGTEVTMDAARAQALVELGQATPVAKRPETAATSPPENASRPRGKVRRATRKPKGGKKR